jgi:hypothetical protein
MVNAATNPNLETKHYLIFTAFTYCNLYTQINLESNIIQSNSGDKIINKCIFYTGDNITKKSIKFATLSNKYANLFKSIILSNIKLSVSLLNIKQCA